MKCEPGIHETIHTESDFVSSIYFYPSLRVTSGEYSDAVAVSYMNKKQLSDPDWSDTYARLKAISVMSSAGIRGRTNGPNRRHNLEVAHSHREVIAEHKNRYPEIPNVEFR